MKKIVLFSIFLISGLICSQTLPNILGDTTFNQAKPVFDSMLYVCLAFIMINVGREFELDKSKWRSYTADYFIAMATAAAPWLLICFYYMVLLPSEYLTDWNAWKETMGAEDLWDYVEKNGITVHQESAFDGWKLDPPSDDQLLTIAALKDVVVPACWKMVYAKDEAEFEAIWDAMVKDAETMGSKEIFDWFKANFIPNK